MIKDLQWTQDGDTWKAEGERISYSAEYTLGQWHLYIIFRNDGGTLAPIPLPSGNACKYEAQMHHDAIHQAIVNDPVRKLAKPLYQSVKTMKLHTPTHLIVSLNTMQRVRDIGNEALAAYEKEME